MRASILLLIYGESIQYFTSKYNVTFGVFCPFLGWGFALLFLVFESFYHKWMLNFVCIYWEDYIVVFFFKNLLVWWITLFSNVNPTLNSWDEPNLLRMHYPFSILLDMNCYILLRILACMSMRDIGPQFTFLVVS